MADTDAIAARWRELRSKRWLTSWHDAELDDALAILDERNALLEVAAEAEKLNGLRGGDRLTNANDTQLWNLRQALARWRTHNA